ncbi:hypothetical protein [Amycolatopsis sp. PS_44_ISF1]|uniref:hypothetical protein n=1 Tax=Amycolatopsis sp. PS_44_ISF1 TaxID=2974917 RepID=UPI0028ECD70D|nr:hypothetical protein [Amycolatopsis sp. PS_44_ISF1]
MDTVLIGVNCVHREDNVCQPPRRQQRVQSGAECFRDERRGVNLFLWRVEHLGHRQLLRRSTPRRGSLAQLAGQPHARLGRAILELLAPEPDWITLRPEPGAAASAAPPHTPAGRPCHCWATTTTSAHATGPPDLLDHPQPSRAALPDVVAAQHRHRRLLSRLGRPRRSTPFSPDSCSARSTETFTDIALDGDA